MITRRKEQDFEAIVLENDILKLEILPELGGKIFSLVNKRTGREWMDRPPGRTFRLPSPGAQWGDGDRCGWDELFPSIDACSFPTEPWQSVLVPDHGELWSVPWAYEVLDQLTLKLTVQGIRWPYMLEKTIKLENNYVRFMYRLSNLSPHPLPYIWAPHPIVAASKNMYIELPASVDRIVCSFSVNERLGARGSEHQWPITTDATGATCNIASMPAANTNIAEKFYVKPPLKEGWCLIRDHDTNEHFKFSFNPTETPYLGIWMNGGGWNGEYHVALEPATGFMDNLEEAFPKKECAIINGGERKNWSLELEIM